MGRQMHAIVHLGLLLLLQQGLHVPVAARSYKTQSNTFPSAPPAAITVQAPTAPRSNVQARAAPIPMGRDPPPAFMPQSLPAAARVSSQNMRLAAPAAAVAAAAAVGPASAPIPFGPSVPYNPNSLYKPMVSASSGSSSSSSSSGIPESHPVGFLAPAATVPIPGRQKGVAGLISSGAEAFSALANLWRQHSGSDADVATAAQQQQPVTPSDYSSSSSGSGYSSYTGPVSQQGGQGPVGIASVVTAAPQPTVYFPSGAMPLANNGPQQYTQQGAVQVQPMQAVRAVDKPGFKSVGSTASSTGGVMSDESRSRRSQPRYNQQGSFPTAAAAAAVGTAAVPARASIPAVMTVPTQPVMQPLPAGLMRMATNNMGAPVAGPLGGPTYIPQQSTVSIAAAAPAASAGAKLAPAAAPSASKVSVASVGSFSSTPAPVASGMDSLHQHFAGGNPPMYAPLPSTIHVAPPKGSKAKGIIAGPSIDDVSATAAAPVAQLSWQLPKKVHVAWAPAADLLRAAPVSPFEIPSSMKEGADDAPVSKGAVSTYLTPTWAPAV